MLLVTIKLYLLNTFPFFPMFAKKTLIKLVKQYGGKHVQETIEQKLAELYKIFN